MYSHIALEQMYNRTLRTWIGYAQDTNVLLQCESGLLPWFMLTLHIPGLHGKATPGHIARDSCMMDGKECMLVCVKIL